MAGWITLAEGKSTDEFRTPKTSISELPDGTPIKCTIETPWYLPIAPLFDLLGAETGWAAQKIRDEAGARIIDVEGVGWHKIIFHMEPATPAFVVPLIIAIAVIVTSVCIAIVAIKLEAFVEAAGPAFLWGILILAMGLLYYLVVGSKKGTKKEKAPT